MVLGVVAKAMGTSASSRTPIIEVGAIPTSLDKTSIEELSLGTPLAPLA
jgi:hypothetical protein